MSDNSSKFWTFVGLPVSLLILTAAYYIKVRDARKFIDRYTPIAHQLLGRFVREPEGADAPASTQSPGDLGSIAPPGPAGNAPQIPSLPFPSPAESKPVVYDLQALARDRSLWPRTVRLKKPVNFPAVAGGKVVGSLVAPAGAEVNLQKIQNGMLGLEYKGGGAWLAVDDTDLRSRVPLQ
jgi:hypothetical protein